VAALVVVLMIGTAGLSYVQALTFPGDAGWQVRTVEWVRDHGGGGLVDLVENWWFAHNQPTGAAPASGSLPVPDRPATGPPVAVAGPQPPRLPRLAGVAPLPGEAVWVPGTQRVGGVPAMFTSYFRPDPAYRSQIVGVAWLDQSLTSTRLIAGTREPGGGWPEGAQVPAQMRPTLLAAFNSGWKMKDIKGGFFADGRQVKALQDGAASLVIDTTGRVTVGQWGRDVSMGPQVAAVRQNLDLIIDRGAPVAGLAGNSGGAWGSALNQFQYTWRSGVGIDRSGNLLYVGGDKLTLAGLAQAMAEAGVQRGMELDIHPGRVTFTSFRPEPGAPFGLAAAKLLPEMSQPTTRYLNPDQRDFFAVALRSGVG
jgi:Phosphodiester glycosidase